MDGLTLLRSARTDITDPTPQALNSGRAALLAHIDGSRREASAPVAQRRRPVLRRIGYSAVCTAAAAAVVTGLVMTDVVGLAGWRGGADAAAAAVLRDASGMAIASSDPIVQPGQYLRVDTTAVYGGTVAAAGNRQIGYLTINESQLYIPADRDDDWVWMRGLRKPYESFGPESEAALQDEWNRQLSQRGTPDYQENVRAPGGAFYGSSSSDLDELAALPRNPYRLLNYIYRTTAGSGPSPDGEALVWMADTLRGGGVPADLRGAIYEAAAMIPGVVVTEDQATLNGRTGVSIGRLEPSQGMRQDIIIDPETGELIGERSVLINPHEGSPFPAGTSEGWTAITTTVVNEAPTGGNVYGSMGLPG
jgi:RNA polymerase sigma-70 factor (ECF subfamily)